MISVCIATYNGENYIYKQVESILKQLSKEDEVIISDNGSTDRTLEILCAFSDSRIHIYNFSSYPVDSNYSKKHYLVTRNFENALRWATGDFIFLSDQDDIWKGDKVKKMISYLKDYDLVMSNYDVISSDDEIIEELSLGRKQICKNLLFNLLKMPFWGCCMAFRKEILKKSMPFPSNLIMHDNWIGLVATLIGKVKYVDESLIYYRRHNANVSAQKGMSTNPCWFKLYYRILLLYMLIKRLFQMKIYG